MVALCYRLMWNLKNTGKVDNFSQISKISFASVNSKLYGYFTTSKGNFLFDLSKVYTDIPNTLDNKDIDVSPEDHKIQVLVNKERGIITSAISKAGSNANTSSNTENNNTDNKEEDKEEVTAETVKDEIIGNDNVDEEKKEEVLDKFEDNILDKFKKIGLSIFNRGTKEEDK